MSTVHADILQSVVETLESKQLFRYHPGANADNPVSRLENEFTQLTGAKYAVAMNSCSSALLLALLSAGLRRGDRVLIPAFTFIAVPSAVIHAGGTPVLVEVDENYVIDLEDLKKKMDGSTRFLMLSHMRGRIADMDEIRNICEAGAVTLIEDAAHSLGVLWDGMQTGRFGVAGAFSAQSNKLIDGGEGGILITDNANIAAKAIIYSGCYEAHWKKHTNPPKGIEAFRTSLPVFNVRMSNLTAAVLIPQLADIERRVQQHTLQYNEVAAILKQSNFIRLPAVDPRCRPVPDSVQFEIQGLSSSQLSQLSANLKAADLPLKILGRDPYNARCFWHWNFLDEPANCPKTKTLIEVTADMRLKLDTPLPELQALATNIIELIQGCASSTR